MPPDTVINWRLPDDPPSMDTAIAVVYAWDIGAAWCQGRYDRATNQFTRMDGASISDVLCWGALNSQASDFTPLKTQQNKG